MRGRAQPLCPARWGQRWVPIALPRWASRAVCEVLSAACLSRPRCRPPGSDVFIKIADASFNVQLGAQRGTRSQVDSRCQGAPRTRARLGGAAGLHPGGVSCPLLAPRAPRAGCLVPLTQPLGLGPKRALSRAPTPCFLPLPQGHSVPTHVPRQLRCVSGLLPVPLLLRALPWGPARPAGVLPRLSP